MNEHKDCVTGLSLSHNGSSLLSNSMDTTLRIWDVRPYAPTNRCVEVFTGLAVNLEKNLLRCAWSPDDQHITYGSSDRYVNVWHVEQHKLLYRLPGHKGSVNEVQFHPNQPVIGSCSSDRTIYLGELDL